MLIPRNLLILLLIIGGAVVLEIFLARRKSRWPGLILPGITLLYALIMALNVVAVHQSRVQMLSQVLTVFLLSNLPTAILLAIYFACREKRRVRDQLDKMNIQDL